MRKRAKEGTVTLILVEGPLDGAEIEVARPGNGPVEYVHCHGSHLHVWRSYVEYQGSAALKLHYEGIVEDAD